MSSQTLAAVCRDYSAAFAIAAESMLRLASQVEAGEVGEAEASAQIEETFDNIETFRPE